jgi:signal transduction histidine kinase
VWVRWGGRARGVRRLGAVRLSRLVLAGCLVVLSAIAVGVLCQAIIGIGRADAAERRSQRALAEVGRLEGSLDAYVLASTGPEGPRNHDAARAAFDRESDALARMRLPKTQAAAVHRLVQADDAYVDALTTRASLQAASRTAAFEDVHRSLGAAERHAVTSDRENVAAAALSLLVISVSATRLPRLLGRPSKERGALDTAAAALAVREDRLRRVAEMQGALRRVATLVAHGVSPQAVFAAVAGEAGRVLGADHTVVIRFEPGDMAGVVAHWNDPEMPQVMPPLDGRWPLEPNTVTGLVRSTERPARMSDYEGNTSAIGRWARSMGLCCVVGCPIKVEGRVWGALIMHALRTEPAVDLTEEHMQEFVELLGTAIANAQSRSDLLSSRARVVAAADESRRRIERDLHDGAQQRVVTLALKLRSLQAIAEGPAQAALRERLDELADDLSGVLDDLQEVSRGIVPPILTRSGLPPALRSLARRSPVPVRLDTDGVRGRLARAVEVAVYYTVCEALTNVVKHARASEVHVGLAVRNGAVLLSVCDNGRGGADLTHGTGLVGLKDRVEALGGRIEVRSPPGRGTSLRVSVPTRPPAVDTLSPP